MKIAFSFFLLIYSRVARRLLGPHDTLPCVLICNTSVKADNLNANTSGITGFIIYACLKDSMMVRQQVTL